MQREGHVGETAGRVAADMGNDTSSRADRVLRGVVIALMLSLGLLLLAWW